MPVQKYRGDYVHLYKIQGRLCTPVQNEQWQFIGGGILSYFLIFKMTTENSILLSWFLVRKLDLKFRNIYYLEVSQLSVTPFCYG